MDWFSLWIKADYLIVSSLNLVQYTCKLPSESNVNPKVSSQVHQFGFSNTCKCGNNNNKFDKLH